MNLLFVWALLFISPLALMVSFHLIFFWMLLEISSIMFVYTMLSEEGAKSKEFNLTYFLVQSIASVGVLMSFLGAKENTTNFLFESQFTMPTLMAISLATKLGMAPLHFWLIKISKALSMNMMFIMLTWQKLIPLSIFAKICFSPVMALMGVITYIVGTMSQIKLQMFNLIILFSSITHLGWIMFSMSYSSTMYLTYLLLYSLILLSIMAILFISLSASLANQLSNKMVMVMSISILSLSGIPPLLGFLLKWMVLKAMLISIFTMMMFTLGACLSFFVYSRMINKMWMVKKEGAASLWNKEKFNLNTLAVNLLLPFMWLSSL